MFTDSFSDFTLDGFINNFHFIRPWWFLAFFALFLILFLLKRIRYYQSPWQHFLPAHLANALLENNNKSANNTAEKVTASSQGSYWSKPLFIGTCIIVALAGPAWQKLPQPVYQLERGAVLIMDMSYSMYATDIKPNRLTRARYKAVDLLTHINEGDVGLIAYAGDAFIISPLTQDIKNVELLLPSLSPDIMPVHGANAIAALALADQTLKNAGHISGDIYWFTDDIDKEEMSDVYAWANKNEHKVNILGVGTTMGAPIKLNGGKLLKDNRGAIVIPKLPEGRLSAIATRSRGVYHTISNDDADIKALTAHLSVNLDDNLSLDSDSGLASSQSKQQQKKQALQGDQYQEQGPWVLILILPFLLSYFRRGSSILTISTLIPLTLLLSLMSVAPSSYAEESNASNLQSSAETTPTDKEVSTNESTTAANSASHLWRNLWQTSDQQAQQHYQQKDYPQAAAQFDDSQWQGSAHYKAGDYQQALDAFKQSDTAQSLYNQGNALAQLQQVDEAIDAYKQALAKNPDLEDAKDNLAKLEALKKQEEQSNKDSQESEDDQKEQQDGDKKDQEQSQDQSDKEQQGDKNQDEQKGDQQQSDEAQQKEQEDQQAKEESEQNNEQDNEQKEQDEKSSQAKESDEDKKQSDQEKTPAQQAIDNKKQETQQKHQQLLNKVTDDPYLLLRNKMRLEYQKRRQEGVPPGDTKKW
jgi:Ca-activated chloride channel family protein